jgi:predicted Zn-dependent protease
MNTFLKHRARLLPRLLGASLIASASLTLFAQCALLGYAGPLLVSESDESRLGAEFDKHLRTDPAAMKEYPVYVANTPERKAFQDYILGLAQGVYEAVPKKEKPGYAFHYTLIDADVQNAFAVPGGYVYIYTGIVKTMKDESELAGVLGHEIAHVTQHHYRDALAKETGLSVLIQVLAGENASELKKVVAQTFGTLASLSVSRDNESDADENGTRYLAATGRNPLGIAKYFERVKNPGPQWLSTHPAPKNRVATVKAQVSKNTAYTALANNAAVTDYKARFDQMTAIVRK